MIKLLKIGAPILFLVIYGWFMRGTGIDSVEAAWNADKAKRALAHAEALKGAQDLTSAANTRTFEAEQALQDKEREHERITAELLANPAIKTVREVVRIPVEGVCESVPTFDWDAAQRVLNNAIRAHGGGATPETTAGRGDGEPGAVTAATRGPAGPVGPRT